MRSFSSNNCQYCIHCFHITAHKRYHGIGFNLTKLLTNWIKHLQVVCNCKRFQIIQQSNGICIIEYTTGNHTFTFSANNLDEIAQAEYEVLQESAREPNTYSSLNTEH